MRLRVVKKGGLTMPGGRGKYAEGEEFDLPDNRMGRQLSAVLRAKRHVRASEPVIVGTPPPPPQSTPAIHQRSVPMAPEPQADNWAKPPWQEAKAETPPSEPEEVVVLEEDAGEQTEGDAPRKRGRPPIHGRYARRDLRPEE